MPAIATTAECTVTEKRSKFLALAAPAFTLDEAKKVVRKRSKKLHKARHHCWACRVRDIDGRLVEQARDDGEVGRPGMILLEQLRRDDLEGIIVVSRFFGGVKLGPAGVGRAFRAAGEGALNQLIQS
jgi:putative IMPACT (imprinted ancient) family translation regulator